MRCTIASPTPVPSNSRSPAVSGKPSVGLSTQSVQSPQPLTLNEALRLANAQSSSFVSAGLNERIAAEDVKQAQAAFLPKVSAPLSYIYTSPALGQEPGTPRLPSFIANNAINEYQAFVNVAGDLDIAGRLRATLARNRALLSAAHAGTEVARRALVATLAIHPAHHAGRTIDVRRTVLLLVQLADLERPIRGDASLT